MPPDFIPEIWAGDALIALRKAMVFGSLVNRDYEGQISKAGDTVRIGQVGPVTIGKYTKNNKLAEPETLTTADMVLQITESPDFHFFIDDVDIAQHQIALEQLGMEEAAQAMKDDSDRFIAGLYDGAAAANKIGSDADPVVPNNTDGDAENVWKLITQMMQKLDEANVPSDGRWIAGPPWLHTVMLNEDKFVSADRAGTTAALRTGEVGQIAGFTVFKSNNVNHDNDVYHVMFGTNKAITWADQINKVERYRPELRFGYAYKGLHLYGAKVIRPDCLGVLYCTPS